MNRLTKKQTAKIINKILKINKLNQPELALRIGVHQSTISRWANGVSAMSGLWLYELERIELYKRGMRIIGGKR